MHKQNQNGYWIIAIIVFIIIVIIAICLLVWAFNNGVRETGTRKTGKSSGEFCLRVGSNWTGYGITQNAANLTQNTAFKVKTNLNVRNIYVGKCGSTIIHIAYNWERLNAQGVVISRGSDEAFGPISSDGSAYLTEIREQAQIKLTPLSDNEVEMSYVEWSSQDNGGKVTTISKLHQARY